MGRSLWLFSMDQGCRGFPYHLGAPSGSVEWGGHAMFGRAFGAHVPSQRLMEPAWQAGARLSEGYAGYAGDT